MSHVSPWYESIWVFKPCAEVSKNQWGHQKETHHAGFPSIYPAHLTLGLCDVPSTVRNHPEGTSTHSEKLNHLRNLNSCRWILHCISQFPLSLGRKTSQECLLNFSRGKLFFPNNLLCLVLLADEKLWNPLTFLFELWLPGNSVLNSELASCYILWFLFLATWTLCSLCPTSSLSFWRIIPPAQTSPTLTQKQPGCQMCSWPTLAKDDGSRNELLAQVIWEIHYPWDAGLWKSSLYNRGAVGSMWIGVERVRRRPNMGVKNPQLYSNPASFLPVVSLTHSHSLLRNPSFC